MNENDLPQEELITFGLSAIEEKKAIIIFQDTDGNYRGMAHKNGQFIQAREGDPNTVVTMLITRP